MGTYFFTNAYLLTCIFVLGCCQQQQILHLFRDVNCQGASINTTASSSPVLTETYTSFQTFGLWIAHPCNSPSTCTGPHQPPVYGHDPICNDRTFPTGDRILITRFGDADQTGKSIYFYAGAQLTGTGRTYSEEGTDLNFNFGSFYHTGTHSWTLYEGSNFNGTERCVTPEEAVNTRGFGIKYVPNETGILGSIREGCGPLQTTTTPQTTTTLQTSTTQQQTTTPPQPVTSTMPTTQSTASSQTTPITTLPTITTPGPTPPTNATIPPTRPSPNPTTSSTPETNSTQSTTTTTEAGSSVILINTVLLPVLIFSRFVLI